MAMRTSLLLLLGWWQLWLAPALADHTKASPSTPTPPHGQRLDALSSVLPLVRFQCQGRAGGYYGDMDFGCSVFHYCGDSGERFSYKCTDGLKFNEMTTSCSAGYFGDCTHPEIIGPAGRDESAKPAPVQSFQKVPDVVKDEDNNPDDPGDYPEPYIQHYDPALDLDYNYEYYDTDDIQSAVPDAEPAASNRMMKSRHFKRSSSGVWDTNMSSALSAFASLVNIPYDNPSTKQGRNDRVDNVDRVQYVDTIDRAFIARPPQRRRTPQGQSSSHFFQLPFFQGNSKKPGRVVPVRTLGSGQKVVRGQQQPLHQRPPTDIFSLHEDPNFDSPSRYRQSSDPHESDNNYDSHANSYASSEVSQTTPDPFRPSSLFSADLDNFQPVTPATEPASPRESTDLVRPYREASPQTGHGAVSSSFQSFSPSSSLFGSGARFPGLNSFIVPQTSPRTVQTTPQSFLPTPSFPSSGNFLFNQPPIHPAVFSQPFHHSPPSTSTTFGGPPASKQHGEGFGHPSLSRQPTQGFHRQPSPQFVQNFHRPPVQSFSHQPAPQPVQSFRRPTSSPHHVQNFVNPTVPPAQPHPGKPPAGLSFTHPGIQKRPVESLVRPTEPPPFIPHTPSSVGSQSHFIPGFQHERPTPQGHTVPQQTFHHSFQRPTEAPSSAATILPQTERPFVTEESLRPHDFSFSFQKTSAAPPVVSDRPGVLAGFHFKGNTQSQSHPTGERPEDRKTGQSTFDQQNTQRRPVSHQEEPAFDQQNTRRRPVSHQEEPAFDQQNTRRRPVSHQEEPAFDQQNTRRRPVSHQEEPAFDQQNTRRRPVSHQEEPAFDQQNTRRRPVSHQEEPAFDQQNTRRRPVSHQEEPAFDQQNTQRRPSSNQQEQHPIHRPATPRQPTTTQQPETTPTLITGLENSEFNNHFLQPHGRRPSITRLQPIPTPDNVSEDPFVHTTPLTTQVTAGFSRQPEVPSLQGAGIFPPQDGIFDPHPSNDKFAQNHHLDNNLRGQIDIPTRTFEEDLPNDIISPGESIEEDKNVILVSENDQKNVPEVTEDVTEATPITTTTTTITTRRPFIRRRPIIRNRLRPRLSSRTTTAAPEEIEPQIPSDGEADVAEANDPPVTEATSVATTTLSPLRQRIQDRLNRLKNRRNYSRHTTTEQPESDTDVTTISPTTPRRRLSTRRGSLNRQRFQSIRSRLRRITTTTEHPESHSESTTTETPFHTGSSRTGSRNTRTNRFRPKLNVPTEDNVLEVKEILRSDQDAQETTRSVVHEKPDFGEQSPADTLAAQTRNVEGDPHEEGTAIDQSLPQDAEDKDPDQGKEGQDNTSESHEDSDQETSVTPATEGGNKVVNPNFRARFREFLKNRKNRLSARYRSTESPDTTDELKEVVDSSEKTPDERDEASSPILKERMQLFEQRRRQLRAKFLSRQTNDGKGVSRRIPNRLLRNKVPSETEPEETRPVSQEEIAEASNDSVKEEVNSREIPFKPQQQKIIVRDMEVSETPQTEGTASRTSGEFKPILGLLTSSRPSPVPIGQHPQEPEIITAPSAVQGEGMMSFKVSTSLGSDMKDSSTSMGGDSENHEPEIAEPMKMIVKEIGIESSSEHEVEDPELTESQSKFTVHEFSSFRSQPPSDNPTEDPSSSSPQAPVLISVLPSVPKASNTAVPSITISSPASISKESHTTSDSADVSEFLKNRDSSNVPAFENKDSADLQSHESSGILDNVPKSQDNKESTNVVKPTGRRVSKPSFNLGAVIGRSKSKSTASPISDSRRASGKEATPGPFPSITMATGRPRLPLEVLLPLYDTR